MSDPQWSERRFRTFNVIDGFNRQACLSKSPPARQRRAS